MRVLVLLASGVMSTTWLACSGDSVTPAPGNGGGAGSSGSSLGGSTASSSGGANNGGSPASGGANNGGNPGSGGSNAGGRAGSPGTGGANNGGSPASGGSNNGGSPGNGGSNAGGRAGSPGSGGSTVVVDAGSIDASRQACVDRINALRATLSLAPLQRWTANETCADAQAKSDSETGTAHGAFSSCPNMAQNECPNYKSIQSTLTSCIDAMWAEGPGADYNAHGHYINMTNTKYTMVTCGFYTTPAGKVWMVQDFK